MANGSWRWRRPDLLQQSAFLDNIGHGLHLDTLCLVDIFEGVEGLGLLVLDYTDLVGDEAVCFAG